VWANEKNDLSGWLAAVGENDPLGQRMSRLLPLALLGKGLARFATTTDGAGRFRLPGVGSGRVACLELSGPGLALTGVLARTEAGPRVDVANPGLFFHPQAHGCYGAEFALVASAARPVVGVVRDLETGRPVAGAVVQSHQFAGSAVQGIPTLSTRTDGEGRYRLLGLPAGRGNMVLVRCPTDQPYLPSVAEVDTGEGEGPAPLDFKLRRGLWAGGQVADADTGRPLAAAVDYYCLYSNPRGAKVPGFGFVGPQGLLYQTDAAGRFRVPVLPGRGVLAVELHGQRTHFLGSSWVTQAGKAYYYGGLTLDAPEDHQGFLYLAHPMHLGLLNYHQLALIDPPDGATAITCDLKVSSRAAPKPEAKP
jgi:hypothetical protein